MKKVIYVKSIKSNNSKSTDNNPCKIITSRKVLDKEKKYFELSVKFDHFTIIEFTTDNTLPTNEYIISSYGFGCTIIRRLKDDAITNKLVPKDN